MIYTTDDIQKLSELVADGRVFVFPTDTVYGIGAVVPEPEAVPAGLAQIFALKERPPDKPLPLLIPSLQALDVWAVDVPNYATQLAGQHWPGALTLVVKASPRVRPALTNSTDGSIALRVPDSEFLRRLLEDLGDEAALLATSANVSGAMPARNISELDPRFGGLSVVVDGGQTTTQTPSTIISCLDDEPEILRAGSIRY